MVDEFDCPVTQPVSMPRVSPPMPAPIRLASKPRITLEPVSVHQQDGELRLFAAIQADVIGSESADARDERESISW